MAFPTVTVNLSITLSPAVIQDIHTHWLAKTSGQVGILAAAMAATDTSFTLNAGAPSVIPAGSSNQITVGSTVLIGNDPMQVTAIDGATYTVTRYATAFPFMTMLPAQPTTTHAAGDGVLVLTSPDPWTLIGNEALRPWAQQVVMGLGNQSATFGSLASGSLTAG